MSDTSIIDQEAFGTLYESTGGDPSFLDELMEAYFTDTPQLFADLRSSLAAGNSADFRRAAHSLKSNSANFGARDLAALSKEMEDMGKVGNLAGAEDKIALAETEYIRVKQALEQKRAELG
ncbi:MAG: Hpt domain-containing protein [Anaerolineae bacterium]